MLPKFLQGSYRRYKNDTDTFVDWLMNAAAKCGSDLKQKGEDVVPHGEAKNYTRKVSLKQLQALAQTVVKNAVTVPPKILAAVQRAIILRKRCARWFDDSGKGHDNGSEEGHCFFITILEDLCDLLSPKKTTQAPHSTKFAFNGTNSEAFDEIKHAANRFSALSLEELGNDEAPQDDTVPSDRPRYEVEDDCEKVEDPDSDLVFQLFCLFEDMHNMRFLISQTFEDYVENNIDIGNLAVVTDTAIHLAKELIEEVLQSSSYQRVSQYQQECLAMELVYKIVCDQRGKDPSTFPDPSLPYNSDMADAADWVYLPTYALLASFKDVLQPDQLPVFKKGYFGEYDPQADRTNMTAGERFKEDRIILLELLPEFALLQRFEIVLPAMDETTRGLVDFIATREVPLWLPFATQILLDVHHALRYHNCKAFNDTRFFALRCKKNVEEYWKLNQTFKDKMPFWDDHSEKVIQHLHQDVEQWVIHDAIHQLKQSLLPRGIKKKLEQAGGVEEHLLLKSHAILSGLLMFNFTLRMQDCGLGLINRWYDVPQLAYVYNLAVHTGMRSLEWPDMDLFINIHGAEHTFVGGRPKTAIESARKLRIATGTDYASASAAKTRKSGYKSQKAARPVARQMEPSLAVKNIFMSRYVEHGKSKFSVENMDRLLAELQAPESSSSGADIMHIRWEKKRLVGALQLLNALKRALYTEEPRLHYNYFGMHQRCIEILRRIQKKEDQKFRQYFSHDYMPLDTLIPNLVLLVITVPERSSIAKEQLGIDSTRFDVHMGSRIVNSCEEVMETYLKDQGDKACKELRAFCKNKSLGEARGFEVESRENWYWTCLEELIDPTTIAALQTGIGIA